MLEKKTKDLRVIIAIHEENPVGPGFVFKDFLQEASISDLFFISHPLLYFKDSYQKSSRFEHFKNGKLINKVFAFHWKLPRPLLFVKDLLYTVIWCFRLEGTYDVFFGIDPLNAAVGWLLKKMGKVRSVVYYNIDFTPRRFENSLMNYLYHKVDAFACNNVDYNWIGTDRTTKARVESGMNASKMAKTVIVPDGNESERIHGMKTKKIEMQRIVYLGHLDKKQGIDLVLDALPKLQESIKDIKFMLIGKGDYEADLKKKVKDMQLDCVEFMGFIADERKIETLLMSSAVAVAPYVPDKNSFTYYSEAGKPKYYLGCGLPVVITNVPAIAYTIDEQKAGIMIPYDRGEFVRAVKTILAKEKYVMYRKNATALGLEFDSRTIFKKALKETGVTINV